MQLFHGTNTDIKKIQLSFCRPFKDFGRGLYLTEIYEQAAAMAKRVVRLYGGVPIVNMYELDASVFSDSRLNIKQFGNEPSEAWAVFIINNRNKQFHDISSMDCNHDNKYDIVIGPVANDDISTLFRQFSDGVISQKALMEGLTYKKLSNQYSFHTEEAISFLKKTGVRYE